MSDGPTHSAHTDSVWSTIWLASDSVISASADGTLKQWNPTSGQVSAVQPQPPHTLGIVSLSADSAGKKVLWNTLEGLTCLWDLEGGDVKGKWESYHRTGKEEVAQEPGEFVVPLCLHANVALPAAHSDEIMHGLSTAWSVSLHPSGETFAATGGSGNISIHSADPASFGERKTVLPSGRSKFGMCCKYVSAAIAFKHPAGRIY